MDATMQAWRKKMPSKRLLTSTINQLVQQKSVAVLYTPTEVERIKQMTDMITEATSDFEADEDWDRILRVVDALSNVSNHAVLKESIWYLKLRLGDPSDRVVILALTLTESIVKNCGGLVHQEIASEAFMSEMEALYREHADKRGRASMEIASRVLDMIQAWGEAFLPYRHEFPLFVDTYHNMRKKGIQFPDQYDESKVPVLTPSSETPCGSRSGAACGSGNQSHGANRIDTSSYSNSSSRLGGLSTPELFRVATSVLEMFEDMLHEAKKDTSAIDTHGVMEELAVEVREIVHRMEGAIPIAVVEEDENLGKYLSVNDELHAALKKYDDLQVNNQKAEEETGAKSERNCSEEVDLIDLFGLTKVTSPRSNKDNQDPSSDDPFADFVYARTTVKTDNADQNKARESSTLDADAKATFKVQQEEKEEDPFASFVQQRAIKILNGSKQNREETKAAVPALQPAAPTKDLINLWDDLPATSPASVIAQPTAKPDLWLEDNLLDTSSHPPAVLSTASSKTLLDDPWSMSVASQPGLSSTTSSSLDANSSDPFDMLGFPTQAPLSTSSAAADPFDSLQPPSSPAQPQQSSQPVAAAGPDPFNPFDTWV